MDLPDQKAREAIFRIHIAGNGLELDSDVDYAYLAKAAEGSSGRNIQHICKDAVEIMVRDMNRDIADRVDGKTVSDYTIKCRHLTKRDFQQPLQQSFQVLRTEELRYA